jgi:patatin-related protein
MARISRRKTLDITIVREKELRLALICYGGVSLAVYMHGITKEVWRLAGASRAWHDNRIPHNPVERAWIELLQTIADQTHIRLRILPDIIAGASAGGINGIFLAQALVTGQSLDPLTDLWLEKADVDELIAPEARASSRFSKLWAMPLVWAFAERQEDAAQDELDDEARDKLQRFMRSRWFEPPFGGSTFAGILMDAFDAMAAAPAGPRLIPEEQPLDLFVTVTEFHGHPETLVLNSPPEITETEHRLILAFRDAPGEPRALGDASDLVFAARATASFPGAFPPFTVAELDGVIAGRDRDWPGRDTFLSRIMPGRDPSKAVLIDGSVLANAPFRPAIGALHNRPARREVDRRFVYIDPKPGQRGVELTGSGDAATPGFFKTIFGALSDLPREQPIRDNLEAIQARSARVRRTRAIIETIRPHVETTVETLFGRTLFLDWPNTARITAWRLKAEARAARDAGHGYLAYCALRTATHMIAPIETAAMADWLAKHDVAYRLRHLRFVSRQLATLDDNHPEIDYGALRSAIYAALGQLIEMDMGRIERPFDLRITDIEADQMFADALGAMPRSARKAPILTYLGFPFYDVATFPLLQGEGHDEFDEVKVDRIAPDDAQSLRKGSASATLKGVLFNNFGAFFSRAYRENDYLWGRLHGAERLVDIVASTIPPSATLSLSTVNAIKARLFSAILDEEEHRCSAITTLIDALRLKVAAMAGNEDELGLE